MEQTITEKILTDKDVHQFGLKMIDLGLDKIVECMEKYPKLDIVSILLRKLDKEVEKLIESKL
jgi:hypothetical protein